MAATNVFKSEEGDGEQTEGGTAAAEGTPGEMEEADASADAIRNNAASCGGGRAERERSDRAAGTGGAEREDVVGSGEGRDGRRGAGFDDVNRARAVPGVGGERRVELGGGKEEELRAKEEVWLGRGKELKREIGGVKGP